MKKKSKCSEKAPLATNIGSRFIKLEVYQLLILSSTDVIRDLLFQKLLRLLAVVEILKVIKYIKIRRISLSLVFDMTYRATSVCLNEHFGFRSRINSISGVRKSSFPRHFLRRENIFARSLNARLWTSFICMPITEALCSFI